MRASLSADARAMNVQADLGGAFGSADARVDACLRAALPPGCRNLSLRGFEYIYRTSARISLLSDAAFHQVRLLEREGELEARFVCVPRQSRDVFRVVEMSNPLTAPLLAGPVDVYVGDDFLLTSATEDVPAGARLSMGLGVEQRIKVARNTAFEEKSGGIVGQKLELRHRIDIEIDNRMPRPARIEVRERVPITREGDDDVTVQVGRVEPPWRAWEDDDALGGAYVWDVRLDAEQTSQLRAEYTVKLASKNELVGGNRRES